jgi:hypothetical protein
MHFYTFGAGPGLLKIQAAGFKFFFTARRRREKTKQKLIGQIIWKSIIQASFSRQKNKQDVDEWFGVE